MTGEKTDRFLRTERQEPLTSNEIKLLGFVLTRSEFEAVLEMQDPVWLQEARPVEQTEDQVLH